MIFDGIFKVEKSGLGWPSVAIPETYGKVIQDEDPRDSSPPLKRYRDPNMIRSFETFQQTVRDEYTRTYGKHFSSEEIEQILQEEEQEIRAE